MERENEGKMPFMDVVFKKGEEDKLDRAVYRKPTHTGLCLSFDSHHPTSVKRGIFRGFVDRAVKVCSDEKSKKGEIGHIMGEMQGNGYLKKFIEKAVRDRLNKVSLPRQSSEDSEDEETNKEEWQTARIPLIEGSEL